MAQMSQTGLHDELSFAAPYLRAAAERRGWPLVLHPDGAFAGQISLPDGSRRYFVRSTYDLNTAGAARVARDKSLAKYFLRRNGLPTIDGDTFFSDQLCAQIGSRRNADAACDHAAMLGYPVMVKINSGSGGEGIEKAIDEAELRAALSRAFTMEDIVLVESYKAGLRDYRVLVLDGGMLVAYERRPFVMVGNGTSTVAELFEESRRASIERGTGSPEPSRVERGLTALGLMWSSVMSAGEVVRPLDVANLSQGGSAVEVTHTLHPDAVRLAVAAARELGLRYAGVDLLSDDATREASTTYILEVNASPTIHQFVALCRPTETRLLELHEKLLDGMAGI